MTDSNSPPRPDPMTIEELEAYPWLDLQPGDRVLIAGSPIGLTLVSQFGTVMGPDPDSRFYYLIQLDVPVPHWDTGEMVGQIYEFVDNLTRIYATTHSADDLPLEGGAM